MKDIEDTMAMERFKDKRIAKKTQADERETAKELLSEKDFCLWEQTVLAENFLNEQSDEFPQVQEALVARVIDLLDGNLVFHYFYTKWLQKNTYNGLPPNSVFEFSLKTYTKLSRRLNSKTVNSEIRDISEYLLDMQLKQILTLWKNVEQNTVPEKMRLELENTSKASHREACIQSRQKAKPIN